MKDWVIFRVPSVNYQGKNPPRNDHISHPWESENHFHKSVFVGRGYVSSLEGIPWVHSDNTGSVVVDSKG